MDRTMYAARHGIKFIPRDGDYGRSLAEEPYEGKRNRPMFSTLVIFRQRYPAACRTRRSGRSLR